MLDLDALRGAALQRDPFDHVIVPRFIAADALTSIEQDFPAIASPGSYPLESLRFGPAFERLSRELQSEEMSAVLGEKLGLTLLDHPTMITVRGQCRATDGKIHTDSAGKVATVLLYINDGWNAEGGRLRLLRSAGDIENYAVEVPPDAGTLLAFPCSENAWHGHLPFEGARRSLQLNWARDAAYLRKEKVRHRISAFFKRAGFG
ncbi:MAG: 2OG-Fe(II) oxygenase [Alphaproteobacteria bacterium]